MSDVIRFTLDGRAVTAAPDETIWQVAKRNGIDIPHLCYTAGARLPGGRQLPRLHGGDRGRARAGGVLHPQAGGRDGGPLRIGTRGALPRHGDGAAARRSARAPSRAHDPSCELWDWAGTMGRTTSRFPARQSPAPDLSHTAMAVNLDACIHCTRCVRACREVQVNDVIGMAGRGARNKIVFDFDDPMGESTCVACGECVQACPTGALMPAGEVGKETPAESIDSVCPYCGVGCQLTFNVKDNRDPLGRRQGRPRQPRQALRQGPLRLRLCKPSPPADGAADPPGRRAEVGRYRHRPSRFLHPLPRSELGRSARPGGAGLQAHPRQPRRRRARRLRLGQGVERGGLPLPRSWCAPASAPTMSITARGSATPPRWRRCSNASAPARSRRASTRSSIPMSSS